LSTSKRVDNEVSRSSQETQQEKSTELERLIFFSDAIFAIAITLLALDIRLPSLSPTIGDQELFSQLLAISPKYYSFGISFLAIGLYWLGHHRMFQYIVRYDGILLLLNLLLLMCIVFIPFPSSVIGNFTNKTATIFYALTLTVTGVLSGAVGLYASAGGRLLSHELDRRVFIFMQIRIFFTPLLFLISAGIALLDPSLARILWYFIAIVAILLLLLNQKQ
jgi:uncharacterized membrane protein